MAEKRENNFKKLIIGLTLFSLASITTACVPDEPTPPIVIDEEEKEKEELIEKAKSLGITLDENLSLTEMRKIVNEREELINEAKELGIENPISYNNETLMEKIEEKEALIEREELEKEARAIGVDFTSEDTNGELREKINVRRGLINKAEELEIEIDIENDTNEEIEIKIEWKEAALKAIGIGAEIEETDTLEIIEEKYNKKWTLNVKAREIYIHYPQQYKTIELTNLIIGKILWGTIEDIDLNTEEGKEIFNNCLNEELNNYFVYAEKLGFEPQYEISELASYDSYEKRLEFIELFREKYFDFINKNKIFQQNYSHIIRRYGLNEYFLQEFEGDLHRINLELSFRTTYIYYANLTNKPFIIPSDLVQSELLMNLINSFTEEEMQEIIRFPQEILANEKMKQILTIFKSHNSEELRMFNESYIEHRAKLDEINRIFGSLINPGFGDQAHKYIPLVMKKANELVENSYKEGLITEEEYNNIDFFDAERLSELNQELHEYILTELETTRTLIAEAHKEALIKYKTQVMVLGSTNLDMRPFINNYLHDMWPYNKRIYELVGMLNYNNFEIENEYLKNVIFVTSNGEMRDLKEVTDNLINFYEDMIINNDIPEWMLEDENQLLVNLLKNTLFYENTDAFGEVRNDFVKRNYIDIYLGDLYLSWSATQRPGLLINKDVFWHTNHYIIQRSTIGNRVLHSSTIEYTKEVLPLLLEEEQKLSIPTQKKTFELEKVLERE